MTKLDIEIDSAETPYSNKASERNVMELTPKDIEKKLQVVLRHIEESAAFDGNCDKDFNNATSVSSLALASGLSVRSLRDYFKIFTGQSLVNYVSQRRAEYAARIFRLYPAVSKAQVACSLGFNCPNGIYRLMRKNGVANINSLRSMVVNDSAIHLPLRGCPNTCQTLHVRLPFNLPDAKSYQDNVVAILYSPQVCGQMYSCPHQDNQLQ